MYPISEFEAAKTPEFIQAIGGNKKIEMRGKNLIAIQEVGGQLKNAKLTFEKTSSNVSTKMSGTYALVGYALLNDKNEESIAGIAMGGLFTMDVANNRATMKIDNFMAPYDQILMYATDVQANYQLSFAVNKGIMNPSSSTIRSKIPNGNRKPTLADKLTRGAIGMAQELTFSYQNIGWLPVDNKLYVKPKTDESPEFSNRYLVFQKI